MGTTGANWAAVPSICEQFDPSAFLDGELDLGGEARAPSAWPYVGGKVARPHTTERIVLRQIKRRAVDEK